MAEVQAAYAQSQEQQLLDANVTAHKNAVDIQTRGHHCALSMGLAATIATAFTGHKQVAIALAVTCIVGLVGAFLGARLASDKKDEPPDQSS